MRTQDLIDQLKAIEIQHPGGSLLILNDYGKATNTAVVFDSMDTQRQVGQFDLRQRVVVKG